MKLDNMLLGTAELNDGVWVESARWDGVEYLVVSRACPAFRSAQERQLAQDAHRGRRRRFDARDAIERTTALLVAHCLLDWRGIEAPDGSTIDLTTAMREQLLTDPGARQILDDVIAAIDEVGEQDAEDIEEIAGN